MTTKADQEILDFTKRRLADAVAIVTKITPSSSNMSATLEAWAIAPDGTRIRLTVPSVCKAMGYRYDKHRQGLRMGGCGYSRSFELAQALARLLGPDPKDERARSLEAAMLVV